MIFLWKISQGLAQGYNVEFYMDERRGRLIRPKYVNWRAPASIRKARESSMAVKGANLFNLLPQEIRNMNIKHSSLDKVGEFKAKIDQYLSKIPDQPTIQGFGRAAESNSLLHQIPLIKSHLILDN